MLWRIGTGFIVVVPRPGFEDMAVECPAPSDDDRTFKRPARRENRSRISRRQRRGACHLTRAWARGRLQRSDDVFAIVANNAREAIASRRQLAPHSGFHLVATTATVWPCLCERVLNEFEACKSVRRRATTPSKSQAWRTSSTRLIFRNDPGKTPRPLS